MRMQTSSWRFLVGILGTTFYLVGGLFLEAQRVGSMDFALSRSPAGTTAQVIGTQAKVCKASGAGAHADGDTIDTDGPALDLSISRAELTVFNQKPHIEMTMVLKNHGIGSALLPWSDSPVTLAQLSPDMKAGEFGYQVATVDFFLGAPFKNDKDFSLRSHVGLWSQPNNEAQSIRISAGQWVELKVRAELICMSGDATRCLSRLRGSQLQVSGWWYQRLLAETYKGACIYSSAAYTERELESHAVDVAGTPYQSSGEVIFDSKPAPRQ